MKKLLLTTAVLCLGLLTSCLSDEEEPAGDYISFESEETIYTFTEIYNPDWNKYFRGENQDQVGITLQDNEKTFLVGINFLDAFLDDTHYPLIIDKPTFETPIKPEGNLQLFNLAIPSDTIFGPNDNVNFHGSTRSNLTFVIDNYKRDVLTGSFSGTIYTETGKSMDVKNGKFKVNIEVYWYD